MTLHEIKQLKIGDAFRWHSDAAVVNWREQVDEMVGTDNNGKEMWVHHFAVAFTVNGQFVTLRSMHPSPKVVGLHQYERNK